jgi:hypothetical protein
VLFIVDRECIEIWRGVGDARIEWRLLHAVSAAGILNICVQA